jgi:trans-o-hydroxybenzylidenepyruvate hydratase-aldolase
MYSAQDLHGVMGMMPAFATADAADIRATSTVDVNNLRDGVRRMVDDGIDVIATTGSFGEFHTLLWEEFQTLVKATIEAVDRRVPLFLGCTALNSREAVRRMQLVQDLGGQGVLVGVPFYFPSTVENAVQFYQDVADLFPDLSIMIYHNPDLHNVRLPVAAIERLVQRPNIVAMKDSHRSSTEFMKLDGVVHGKISVFVNQLQYFPYAQLGAPGLWSIDSWMGPWPLLRLRNAVGEGDAATARRITEELTPAGIGEHPNLEWRETAAKISIDFAGYVKPGPLRPPFVRIPPEVTERARKRAEFWNQLCDRYRPEVQAAALATVR